jgi:hypothetical protein
VETAIVTTIDEQNPNNLKGISGKEDASPKKKSLGVIILAKYSSQTESIFQFASIAQTVS